jgi:hypothetical protein
MTATLVDQQPTDSQELAKRVRSHPFVDGPTRKLVRSWIQHDPPPAQIPWIPLAKPLGDCRVTLVSSADIYHLHIDPRFGHQDLDCVLPLRRLRELSADGLVGEVAATHYSFMGYVLQPRQLLSATAPRHRGPDGRGGGGCGRAGAGVTDLLPVGRTGPANHRSPGHRHGGVVDDPGVHCLGRGPPGGRDRLPVWAAAGAAR